MKTSIPSAAQSSQPAKQTSPAHSITPQSGPLAQLAAMMNQSPQVQAQLKVADEIQNSEPVQRQMALAAEINHAQPPVAQPRIREEKPAQREAAPTPNRTGLPDQLKSGVESLSGISLDDVNVHYNSAKPAQLNALAYAQGTDIHVAPGQEQHLPHEAWHIVQQKQGRVKPTMQMKAGVSVNDDPGLEKEADVMGCRAMSVPVTAGEPVNSPLQRKSGTVAQLFPYSRTNTRTNRTFQITDNGARLDADQTAGDANDPHSGYATYSVQGNSLILGHIQSDPEEGSGIGSLLMYYLAKIAEGLGLDAMSIPGAAPTAVGFYELLGFVSADIPAAAEFEREISQDTDERGKAKDLYVSTRAKIDYNTDPENRRNHREWGRLEPEDQQRLISEQEERFQSTSLSNQIQRIQEVLHGRAVTRTGLTAITQNVLDKTAPLLNRWSAAGAGEGGLATWAQSRHIDPLRSRALQEIKSITAKNWGPYTTGRSKPTGVTAIANELGTLKTVSAEMKTQLGTVKGLADAAKNRAASNRSAATTAFYQLLADMTFESLANLEATVAAINGFKRTYFA